MKKIQLSKKDIYYGYLMLVNKHNPLNKEAFCGEQKLTPINEQYVDILLEDRSAVMLDQLIKACNAEKRIVPISGYRSLQEQQQIYYSSLREKGKVFTSKYVALPNCSEHQTGMAIDVAKKKESIDLICPDFPYEGICQSFREKAVTYGYIERYPKDKEAITGIGHEPWHFRYVGFPHSKIMWESKLTLEEYITLLRKHHFSKNPIMFKENGVTIEVSYVNLLGNSCTTIEILKGMVQISGNNIDGAIITVWR